VAQDNDSKKVMQLALYRLLVEDLELLKARRLDRNYFNALLAGGDPIRDLLRWLDQGEAFQASRNENEWQAFVEVCKAQLAYDPQNDGVLAGASKLAAHEGSWHGVWERFCEAPTRYPHIPSQIRKCRPPNDTIFWHTGDGTYDGWPQWNEEQEKSLQLDLLALGQMPPHKARDKLKELEHKHGRRRSLVWCELGEAPLACALEHLVNIAELTTNSLAVGTIDDLVAGYQNYGWKVDDGVIRALAHVESMEDIEAVSVVIRLLYLSWVEESARYLQKIWYEENHGQHRTIGEQESCLLFVDGLRFDCSKRLAAMLEQQGFCVQEEVNWSALPSVTGSGKAAVAPIGNKSDRIAQGGSGYNFEPMTSHQLRKAIEDNGYLIPAKNSPYPVRSSVDARLWVEFGDIDREGHERGWKLAKSLDTLLCEITKHIASLLSAGWERVRVVTDHGWLLLPGGLPKIELPSALTESKWGRCASLKVGASSEDRLYAWYWDPNQYFALADGISCFRMGEEYAHGGLSLQEALTLQLAVVGVSSHQASAAIEITDVVWQGLRCKVAVDGVFSGLSLDIRTQAGNSSSSVVLGIKLLKDNGTASVVVEDEELVGREAIVVLVDANGSLAAQIDTVIGGERP
jgi:hypothetical protein